jgi:hypothetical protein
MNDELKKKQLRNHKLLATGLFLLMAVIFITTTILEKEILHIGLVTFVRFPKLQWLALWQIGLPLQRFFIIL